LDSTDPRYVPIIHALGRRALDRGALGELTELVGFSSGFGDPSLRAFTIAAVRKLLAQRSTGGQLNPRTADAYLRSGIPDAHVEVLRWFGQSEYADQQAYDHMRDIYDPVRKLPPVKVGKVNGEMPSAADKAAIRDVEEWVRSNRGLLVYDPTRDVMSLAADPDAAARMRAQHELALASSPDSPQSDL